ncbi:tape measure protein [Gallaecimonas kandeliae]|uniref:tape measure protein n=1 Tax=Gallaecimonas kandeliae TaxID=3029055 RepID=UPI0026471DD2|nr:tape measure protein [Gallaecimonas kandeliae]WKE65079.1 tape measure protein [Gallaecimonas kandeliae]
MADKNLELALKISADLAQARREVEALADELGAASDASDKADKGGRRAAAGVSAAGTAMNKASGETRAYAGAVAKADASTRKLEADSQRLTTTTRTLGGGLTAVASSVKALTLTMAAGFGLHEIVQSADAWTAYQNRLRLVTHGEEALAQATNDVYAIARRSSQQLDTTANVYQRFAQNADRLGISQHKVAELTDTVNKAIAISGGTAASSEAALVQFGQALGSGVLRGDEFRSVMEQAPGLALALADGLHVTLGELRAMANQGQLTGDVIVRALTEAKNSVDEKFATRVRTIAQATTELGTAFTRLIGIMSSGEGVGTGIANVIGDIADILDTLSDHAGAVSTVLEGALILAMGRAIAGLTNLGAAKLQDITASRQQVVAAAEAAPPAERAAVVTQEAAVADQLKAKAALDAAIAEEAATKAEAERTAVLARTANGLSGKAALDIRAAEADAAHAAAEARLTTAIEARAGATEQVAIATVQLTRATTQNTAAAASARVANSLLLSSFNAVKVAGSSLLTLIGGPVGLIVSVGLMAASFIDFGDDAKAALEQAKQAAEELSGPLDKVIERLNKLSEIERKQEMGRLAKDLQAFKDAAIEAAGDIVATVNSEMDRASRYAFVSPQTQSLLLQLRAEANKAAGGGSGNFDGIYDSIKNAGDISDITKNKLLGLIEEIAKGSRQANEFAARLDEVKAALGKTGEVATKPGNSLSPAALAKANAYLLTLEKQAEKLENLKAKEKALAFLKRNDIAIESELGKKILEQAEANDKLKVAKDKRTAADRKARQEARAAAAAAKAHVKAQNTYVKRLERQAATHGQTAEKAREYDLAEQGLTGTLLARAKAAIAALDAQDKLKRAEEDSQKLASVQAQLDPLQGDKVAAARARMEQEFGKLRAHWVKENNKAGVEAIDNLINLKTAQARLDQLKEAMSRTLGEQSRVEQSIQTQQETGALTEIDARDQLLDLHRKTSAELERQRPLLEELAKQPGAVGQAAQEALAALNQEMERLQATTSLLQSTLRDGLQSGFSDALQGLAKGTLSLRGAIATLAQSVSDALTKMVSDGLAQIATKQILGIFSQTAGEQVAAINTVTAAKTASDTTMAVSSVTAANTAAAGQAGAAAQTQAEWAGPATTASIASWGAAAGIGIAAVLAALALSRAFNTGGHVRGPGTGTSDSIPARLSDNEFVTRAAVVTQPGALGFLHDFNQRGMPALDDWASAARHATGGLAGVPAPQMASPSLNRPLSQPASGGDAGKGMTVQIVNALDAEDMANTVLATPAAVRQVKNLVKANRMAFKAILEK